MTVIIIASYAYLSSGKDLISQHEIHFGSRAGFNSSIANNVDHVKYNPVEHQNILEDLAEMASAEEADLVELAGHAQRAAGHAQRMIDELDALQLSVGTRGRPVPNRAAFDRDDASAASRTAPPSANRRPRRRVKSGSTEAAGDDDVGMDGL